MIESGVPAEESDGRVTPRREKDVVFLQPDFYSLPSLWTGTGIIAGENNARGRRCQKAHKRTPEPFVWSGLTLPDGKEESELDCGLLCDRYKL